MARKYWLLKTEPGCFSIDHLASEPNGIAGWDGVRNYQARNMLRDDIQAGDGVLFYHSSVQPAGIAGICEVVRDGYPDETARDPEGEHFDPRATAENPIWYQVDVQFKSKLPRLLTLPELRDVPGLENMMLLQRGSRLSVQPVRPDEWKIIQRLIRKL